MSSVCIDKQSLIKGNIYNIKGVKRVWTSNRFFRACNYKDCNKCVQKKTDWCLFHNPDNKCNTKECIRFAIKDNNMCAKCLHPDNDKYPTVGIEREQGKIYFVPKVGIRYYDGKKFRKLCKTDNCEIQAREKSEYCCKCGAGGRKCSNCDMNSANPKYYPLCCICWYHKNGIPPKNYKVKQSHFHEVMKDILGKDIKYRYDLEIDGGCSKRRPDWFVDMITHTIIIECDEYQHKDRNQECEVTRMNELFTDCGDRPIVFIRFNPDSYKIADKKYRSCFYHNDKKSLCRNKSEFTRRTKIIDERLTHHITTIPDKLFTIEKLFYDITYPSY